MKTILDLCAGTGSWSKPYADAGYNVVCLDLPDNDVRLFRKPFYEVHGILAAPPCTVFAKSGYIWIRTKDEMLEGLSVVDACLRIIFACNPVWWALENPQGKLSRYLGDPVFKFDPCDFGDPWTKRTCLWGKFNIPVKNKVEPIKGSITDKLSGTTKQGITLRSKTPDGFAKAFFEANP